MPKNLKRFDEFGFRAPVTLNAKPDRRPNFARLPTGGELDLTKEEAKQANTSTHTRNRIEKR